MQVIIPLEAVLGYGFAETARRVSLDAGSCA